jgi:choline dehydrogenase-like flavoprotein
MLVINIRQPVTPLPSPFPKFHTLTATLEVFYDAWKSIPGAEYPQDGSEGKAGIFWVPSSENPYTQTRSYARTAYYDPVQNRTNYNIITGQKVVKINFNRDGGDQKRNDRKLSAKSVKIVSRNDNSSIVTVSARKEIILAAGAIHTPQILQLSGVGPRAVLEAAGVEVLLHLPGVGSNFQDHSWFSMGYDCK